MKIKMLKDVKGASNESGNATRIYQNGEIVSCDEKWLQDLGKALVDGNLAMEVKIDEPKETKKKVTKKKATKKKSK